MKMMIAVGAALCASTVLARTPNYNEAKVAKYTLPDVLKFEDGRRVANRADWFERRKEILRIYEREMYGRTPPKPETVVTELFEEGPTAAGLGIRRQYRMWFRPDKTGPYFDWLVLIPNRIRGAKPVVKDGKVLCENRTRVPVVLFLNYYGNHALVSDKVVQLPENAWMRMTDDHQPKESHRGKQRRTDDASPFLVEDILARGYAVMSACYCQVSPDAEVRLPGVKEEMAYTGVFDLWPKREKDATDNITSLGAWAWSLSRGLDLAERIPEIDARRSVVTGCSRLAKSALLAASRDERFPVCVPVQTGGGGCPLLKRDYGENVSTMMASFPHWYCKAFGKYVDNEKALEYDQHFLLATIAPRHLLVEGFNEGWFDTKGEFLACRAAQDAWKVCGLPGMPGGNNFPENGSAASIGVYLGYMRRNGLHGINSEDWRRMLDFADRAFADVVPGGLWSQDALKTAGERVEVKMLDGERWWGAANRFGTQMPFDAATDFEIDLTRDGYSNQYASFLVSDRGRYVWCDDQCTFNFSKGVISVMTTGAKVEVCEAGRTLRDAFLAASKAHFPPSGRTPDLTFVRAPQYNTWIELTYNQNERDILAYAKSMLDNGLPPGVFMIDDTWQTNYGVWEFDPKKFRDPKGMCDKLHAMGFKVVLWVCPWVSMDSQPYRTLLDGQDPFKVEKQPTGGFLTLDGRTPAPVTWWNGTSALLDFTHPNARRWFTAQLDRLVRDYGVDGFKLDGGALHYYTKGLRSYENVPSGDQANGYLAYALRYPTCEYRHAWKSAGLPIVERLHDKNHNWSELRDLIPGLVAGGLLGHPFLCPDMIGGGNWRTFVPGSPFEPELFIRSAQVHALCGMMQFSASPWRVLDAEGRQIIRDLVKMRQEKFSERFVELAVECGKTGEPMIRNLEYVFPGRGYAEIRDEFMMGDFLLVAPVVEKGARSRTVTVPPGSWQADDGTVVEGPKKIVVDSPLSRLPHFVKIP